MQKNGWLDKKFLIDGFPRNQDNKDGWDQVMGDDADMQFVLFLDCEENTMIERINKRSESAGEEKRNDDNMEVLIKRFKVFKEQSIPIVELFDKVGKVRKINSNVSTSEVYNQVKLVFNL